MKWFNIGCIILVIYLFITWNTSTNSIQYIPKENNKMEFYFKFQPEDSIMHTIFLRTTPVKKKNDLPMCLQTGFKGKKSAAEKVLTIDLKLYLKNPNTGLYFTTRSIIAPYSHFSFSSQYYTVYGIGARFYSENLNKLIRLPGEYKKDDRICILYVDNLLHLVNYPKEVIVVIIVKWIGGEQKFITSLKLTELDAEEAKINPFR